MLSALADPILPVFAVLALGLALGRTGLFSEQMARTLNAFVFYIGQPALIFLLAANAPFSAYDLPALGLYLASELILYFGVALIAWRAFKRDPREAILLGMTAVFVNHLYYVLPIARLMHGAEAVAPIEGVIFIDVAVLFCGTIFVMDIASRGSVPLKDYPLILAKNPALLALALGIAANLASAVVPSGFNTFAKFSGSSAPPISLFALGVILARVDIFKMTALLSSVVFAKVLLHPVLAFALMAQAAVPVAWSNPLTLVAAGPCGAMPFVIALQYKVETETIAKAILVSTIVTLISLSALTSLMPP
jgi:predicted permease